MANVDSKYDTFIHFTINLNFRICNKLLPTQSSSATITTSTSFELASSHARVTSINSTKQDGVRYSVSQSVSELVTRVEMIGLGSDEK